MMGNREVTVAAIDELNTRVTLRCWKIQLRLSIDRLDVCGRYRVGFDVSTPANQLGHEELLVEAMLSLPDWSVAQ